MWILILILILFFISNNEHFFHISPVDPDIKQCCPEPMRFKPDTTKLNLLYPSPSGYFQTSRY